LFAFFCLFSQHSVGTRLRCGGKYNSSLAESSSERILKIGQHMPMLCLRIIIELRVFLTDGVNEKRLPRQRVMAMHWTCHRQHQLQQHQIIHWHKHPRHTGVIVACQTCAWDGN